MQNPVSLIEVFDPPSADDFSQPPAAILYEPAAGTQVDSKSYQNSIVRPYCGFQEAEKSLQGTGDELNLCRRETPPAFPARDPRGEEKTHYPGRRRTAPNLFPAGTRRSTDPKGESLCKPGKYTLNALFFLRCVVIPQVRPVGLQRPMDRAFCLSGMAIEGNHKALVQVDHGTNPSKLRWCSPKLPPIATHFHEERCEVSEEQRPVRNENCSVAWPTGIRHRLEIRRSIELNKRAVFRQTQVRLWAVQAGLERSGRPKWLQFYMDARTNPTPCARGANGAFDLDLTQSGVMRMVPHAHRRIVPEAVKTQKPNRSYREIAFVRFFSWAW